MTKTKPTTTQTKLDIWNAVSHPPPEALKQIGGGRLRGMTDIKPQWRYQIMTETFGPCGIGWKFTVDKLWTEETGGVTVIACAQVSLHIKDGGQWSEAIPGVGGNQLVEVEKSGPHANDEAYKMAVTDALSTAMKVIGVGAAIYSGGWDGSKYRPGQEPPAPPQPAPDPAPAPDAQPDKSTFRSQALDLLGQWSGLAGDKDAVRATMKAAKVRVPKEGMMSEGQWQKAYNFIRGNMHDDFFELVDYPQPLTPEITPEELAATAPSLAPDPDASEYELEKNHEESAGVDDLLYQTVKGGD